MRGSRGGTEQQVLNRETVKCSVSRQFLESVLVLNYMYLMVSNSLSTVESVCRSHRGPLKESLHFVSHIVHLFLNEALLKCEIIDLYLGWTSVSLVVPAELSEHSQTMGKKETLRDKCCK